MDYQKEATSAFQDALGILKFNEAVIAKVQKKKEATRNALIFLIAPSVINLILVSVMWGGFSGYLIPSVVMAPAMMILMIFVVHIVAMKFFKGKGQFEEFFRVIGYVSILQFVGVAIMLLSVLGLNFGGLLGIVSLVVGIYSIILAYKLLMKLYNLKSTDAVIVLVIGIIASAVIGMLVNRILFPGYGGYGYYSPRDAEGMMREMFEHMR